MHMAQLGLHSGELPDHFDDWRLAEARIQATKRRVPHNVNAAWAAASAGPYKDKQNVGMRDFGKGSTMLRIHRSTASENFDNKCRVAQNSLYEAGEGDRLRRIADCPRTLSPGPTMMKVLVRPQLVNDWKCQYAKAAQAMGGHGPYTIAAKVDFSPHKAVSFLPPYFPPSLGQVDNFEIDRSRSRFISLSKDCSREMQIGGMEPQLTEAICAREIAGSYTARLPPPNHPVPPLGCRSPRGIFPRLSKQISAKNQCSSRSHRGSATVR